VVRRDEQLIAVEAIDDFVDQIAELGDRPAYRSERLVLRGRAVPNCVDLVVVDVDDPVGLDVGAPLVLFMPLKASALTATP